MAATPAAKNDGAPRIVNSSAGDVHIQYRLYGSGTPLVVLVHGWSCDSNYWSAQIKPLAEHYTVMTVDLAGHGASGANRKDFSMRAFGADVASSVLALPDAGKVILVGHSMGGPVAVEAAAQLGDRVLAVIGVDTFRSIGDKPPSAAESAKQLAPFEKDFIGNTRALVAAAFFRKDSDPLFVRRIADDMSQAPPEVAIPAIRELSAWRGEGPMRALNLPIVAINSDLHGVTDEARIRKLVPQFSVVTIADTGHFLMMERPDKFNPALLQQLAKLSAR
jgi:pimeloyl-ACP methyl ester carboxylesterase